MPNTVERWGGSEVEGEGSEGMKPTIWANMEEGKEEGPEGITLRALFLPGGLSGFTASPVRGAG